MAAALISHDGSASIATIAGQQSRTEEVFLEVQSIGSAELKIVCGDISSSATWPMTRTCRMCLRLKPAWARIDGTIFFLIHHQGRRLRLIRDAKALREGGAPTYYFLDFVDEDEFETKAAVAAIRFERTGQPSRNNLYNDWLAVRGEYRPLPGQAWLPYSERRAQRRKTAKLIRFAKAIASDDLPLAERAGDSRYRIFSHDWGYVRVDRISPKVNLADSFEYTCGYNRKIEQSPNPQRAKALACAAALLLDFPHVANK